MKARALALGLICVVACASDVEPPETRDGGPTAARDAGPESPDAGPAVFVEPVLEQPSTGAYACTVTSTATIQGDRFWSGYDFVEDGTGTLWLVRMDGRIVARDVPPLDQAVRMAPVQSDGRLGPDITLFDEDPVAWDLAAARLGEEVVVAWSRNSEVQVAVVDTSGNVRSGPTRANDDSTPFGGHLGVAARDTDAFVHWRHLRSDQRIDLIGRPLDATGTFTRTSVALGIEAFGDVFGVVRPAVHDETADYWIAVGTEGSVGLGRFRIDAPSARGTGLYRGDAPFGAVLLRPSFVEHPLGVLAAWSILADVDEPSDAVAVQVVRTQETHPIAEPALLRAPRAGVEMIEPQLFEFDDAAVGLAWSEGVRWVNSPTLQPRDHDIHLVLLDRDTLRPASEVVTIERPYPTSGLLEAQYGVIQGAIVVVAKVLGPDELPGMAIAVVRCSRP